LDHSIFVDISKANEPHN